jgi:uncharacterized protein
MYTPWGSSLHLLVKQMMKPFLNTFSNRRVNTLDIKPEDIRVVDIAHGLALCNRFAGHTRYPISVAYHSIWVSTLVDDSVSYEVPMAALLHDASEAYLGDVTKWLKGTPEMLPYREAEDRATKTILSVFGCEHGLTEDVSAADKTMVCWEAEQGIEGFFDHLMPPGYAPVVGDIRDCLNVFWEVVDWKQAEHMFHKRFNELLERKPKKVVDIAT